MFPDLNFRESTYVLPALDGGIIIDEKETRINENNSPDMLNMIFDGNILKKREGQQILYSEEKNILSCYEEPFYNYIIYHTEDKIKAYHTQTKEITVLMVRLSEKEGVFFSYNGHVYYTGTGNFYKISLENNSLSCKEVEGYIPTVLINCDSSGIGDKYEEFNFLTNGFKATYNTGESKAFTVPNSPLDESKGLTVKFENSIVDKDDYIVDFETGVITFYEPLEKGHNSLEVTAFSTDNSDREKITNCKIYEIFGGAASGIFSGTRIFLSGNEKYSTTFFYSELKNPEYFPINQFDILGDTNDPIRCMGKQYNSLIFLKEKSAYISYYNYEDSGVNFSVSQISDIYGCDCPKSIVTIDNQLTWLHSNYGVLSLFSTSIKDEKNIRCISENINGIFSEKALLNRNNLQSALGFVNRGKYYIVTDKYTYVLNMRKNFSIGISPSRMSWFVFDNIVASNCFFINREVYLIRNNSVVYFSKVLYDLSKDIPIKAYVKTKSMDFGLPGIFKYINGISFYLGALNNSYFKMIFHDENGELNKKYEYQLGKFNLINFSFSEFTFYANMFSVFLKRKIFRRRCNFFSITFENYKENSQMAISDILISYNKERGARYNGI